MVLVSCGSLCGLLGSLTKTLESLQSIVSQTMIPTEMIYFSAAVWRIVFERFYGTLRWRYFVFCKDRPRWRQRVFDLLPSNLLSAGNFTNCGPGGNGCVTRDRAAALPFTFNTTLAFTQTKPVITDKPLIHSDAQWKRPKHHSCT